MTALLKLQTLIRSQPTVMEKSKSFPEYSSYVKARYAFEDRPNAYSFNGPNSNGDEFAHCGHPETKRKKRVASYNMYSMERKLKSSFQNSFKWIKSKFTDDYF